MPVSSEYAESNRSQTERLRRLASGLDSKRLAVRLPNGWTVAGALLHVAFWDRHRLFLMRCWAEGKEETGHYSGNVFNAASVPLLEQIPPERAPEIAIRAAEEVDALLLELPDELIAAALARPDAPNLDRGSHRRGHFDTIEKALAAAGLAVAGP
jgi:hypothetical protein